MLKVVLAFLCMCFASLLSADSLESIKIGENEIFIFSIKQTPQDVQLLIPQNKKQKELIAAANPAINQHHILVIKNKNFNALVDTGYPDTIETLKKSLKQIKLKPSDITDIILTHAHPDHIGGVLQKDKNIYPNATLHLDKKEYEYWLNQDNQMTKNTLKSFDDKIEFFNAKSEVIKDSKIYPIPAYGHTPGHNLVSFANAENKEEFVFVADLLHFFDIQVAEPSISVIYDVNPKEAAKTRQAFLKQFKAQKTKILGTHFPFSQAKSLE